MKQHDVDQTAVKCTESEIKGDGRQALLRCSLVLFL